MPYNPEEPLSVTPGNFRIERLLYFDGVSAVMIGYYKGAPHQSIGMRWMEAEGPLGYPVTRGNPMWMVVPEQLAVCMLEGILREGLQFTLPLVCEHDAIRAACAYLRQRLAENGDGGAEPG